MEDEEEEEEEEEGGRGKGGKKKRARKSAAKPRGGKKKKEEEEEVPVKVSDSEEEDEEEEDAHKTPEPKPRGRKGGSRKAGQKSKGKAKQTKPKAKRAASPASSPSEVSDSESDVPMAVNTSNMFTPGGTDKRRIIPPIGGSANRMDESDSEEEGPGGLRRSRRRRWKPFEYWKSEHLDVQYDDEYEMPVPTRAVREGVLSPELEAASKRKRRRPSKSDKKGKKGKSKRARTGKKRDAGEARDDDSSDEEGERTGTRHATPMPFTALPEEVQKTAEDKPKLVVDVSPGKTAEVMTLQRGNALSFQDLPGSTVKHRSLAAAAFDTPQFLSGTVKLEVGATKDRESTQQCTQVFSVMTCQPGALVAGVADKSLVLNPFDHFFVPPGTEYSITNHSAHTVAMLAFVLLKDGADADDESVARGEGERGDESSED